MAHFAEIGEDNKVLRVIVVANEENLDGEGNENEVFGAKFCRELLGGTWKQTSYNNSFRKRFAGLNFTYDSAKDAFIPSKILLASTWKCISGLIFSLTIAVDGKSTVTSL